MPERIKSHSDPRLKNAYEAALSQHGGRPDVWGVDIGYRYDGTRMRPEDGLFVRVHVSPEVAASDPRAGTGQPPLAMAFSAAAIPDTLEGVPLVRIHAKYGKHHQVGGGTTASDVHKRTVVVNPLRPGVQVAQQNGTGGTLGLIVVDLLSGEFSILSNEHVLQVAGVVNPTIVQPTFLAGGTPVATFTRAVGHPTGDAALAALGNPTARPLSAVQFGTRVVVAGPDDVVVGDVVRKSGAASGITDGVVDGIGRYRMADNESVGMDGFRIVAKPRNRDISKPGDSGAVWFRKSDHKGVGLHVGGDITVTDPVLRPAIAAHLPAVLQALNAAIRPVP